MVARPLSPEQIEYALDDVRYLLPLKAHLEELERSGRLSWLAKSCTELEDTRNISTDPDRAWLRAQGLRPSIPH